MINELFATQALEKFVGCDSDEIAAGNPTARSIWLFGIEHGAFKSSQPSDEWSVQDAAYSIEFQLRFPYNQKAFKLLAAAHGSNVNSFRDFAETHQPFVRGNPGFFKGNLFPMACHNVNDWPLDAKDEIGSVTKEEYRQWCVEHRIPAIKKWVDEFQPKLFIGIGITHRDDFSSAVFGKHVTFKETSVTVNGYVKRIFFFEQGWRKLVVLPHFSGMYGLNSKASLQLAGQFLASYLGEA